MPRSTLTHRLAPTIAAIVALAFPAGAAADATISPTVLTDDFTDNTACSLREAVQIANTNNSAVEDACVVSGTPGTADRVQLSMGTYELDITDPLADDTNATGDLDITTETLLTLDGAGAGGVTTIDTDDTPAFNDRVLEVLFSSTGLAISDLTITDGNASLDPDGGGGVLSDGPLTLTNARVFSNTSATTGGGLAANQNLTINGSTIIANQVTDGGGGGGGGIALASAPAATIDDSVVRNNTVTDSGNPGGAGIQSVSSTLTVTDSVLKDNTVNDTEGSGQAVGGSIDAVSGSATIRRSTLSTSTVQGGGVRFGGAIRTNNAQLTLVNSTVSGNFANGAGGNGGGIAVTGSSNATIVHTTFGPNTAGAGGSAIYHDNSTTTVRGSLIEAAGVGACSALGGSFTSLDDNVVTDTSCFAETGNDDTDADLMLTPLADNGAATQAPGAQGSSLPLETHLFPQTATQTDHVPSGDCLDHPSGALAVDERGFGRPNDGDGNGIAACEAGALELQVPAAPTLTGSTPTSGSNDNNPEIKGTASAGTSVSLYSNGTCTSAVAGSGTDTEFANPGLTVVVPDNSTTTFFATASNLDGTSTCSVTGLPYSEVTPPPLTPVTPTPTTSTPSTQPAPRKKCKKKRRAAAAKKCKRRK